MRNVTVNRATAIRVGENGAGAVMFDRDRLRLAAGWTGGYLQHSDRRFGLLNTPTPVGKMTLTTTSGPGWAGPKGQWKGEPATLPLPRDWGRFTGLYLHGKRVVLAYTVGGAEVRESPWLETAGGQALLVRSVEVGPSKGEMRMLAGELPGAAIT